MYKYFLLFSLLFIGCSTPTQQFEKFVKSIDVPEQLSYNVRKTDSMVMPLTAIIKYDMVSGSTCFQYEFIYDYQDDWFLNGASCTTVIKISDDNIRVLDTEVGHTMLEKFEYR